MPDIVPNLLQLSSEVSSVAEFLESALDLVLTATGVEVAALARAALPDWSIEVVRGTSRSAVPLELAAEAAEAGDVTATEGWLATALRPASRDGSIPEPEYVLLIRGNCAESQFGRRGESSFRRTASGRAKSSRGGSGRRAWKQFSRSPTSGIKQTKWKRCWSEWRKPRRDFWTPTAPASFSGTPRTRRSSAARRSASSVASCACRTTPVSSARSYKPVSRGALAASTMRRKSIAPSIKKPATKQKRFFVFHSFRHAGARLGAFEVLNKKAGVFTAEDQRGLIELASYAAVALENTQHLSDLLEQHEKLVEQAAQDSSLVGESPAIQAVRATVKKIADTDLAVLVLGENGTGKEVVARAIHFSSRRRKHPFIAVNCAALTETLLESELFGHEKGAFTDAHESRAGKFELASGGTLFLDEIGDMSLAGQAKLLRVLEEKTVVRVGGSRSIHTDVRVVAATNQMLADLVRAKRFREDLYFRLNVVSLELPPLRERGDDVLLLAEHFLQQFCQRAGRRTPKFTAAARKRLESHTWPGNVRELRNLMERLAYLSSSR